MPKAFSEREKELIRKRLEEQGYKMFALYGLKKTNIEDIAKAAGISKGAFYSFYESKEALFMDVIEMAEKRVRLEIMAAIDTPGSSPRARLFTVFKKAFSFFEALPILQFFTGFDFDLLFNRIPAEKFQEHLASDLAFFDELISHCREVGIPIQAEAGQITALLYPLVLSLIHETNFGKDTFSDGLDMHLELIAAFCLGEVEFQLQKPVSLAVDLQEGNPI